MLSLLKIRLSDTIDQVEEQFVVFSLLNLIISNKLLTISRASRLFGLTNFKTTR